MELKNTATLDGGRGRGRRYGRGRGRGEGERWKIAKG